LRRRWRANPFPDGLPDGLPRYVVAFVRDLPTAAQGWRLCTQSAADEARLRQALTVTLTLTLTLTLKRNPNPNPNPDEARLRQAGRVNLRLAAEHADGTGFR